VRPLLDDDECLQGIALIVELIANNNLDTHSRDLLTASCLIGTPKPNSTLLRPLAMGEFFLKLAANYCISLGADSHAAIFEPIQLAVGTPCGAERAVQRIQACIEAYPTEHITIHIDATNAFPSLERAPLLASVYADRRLCSSWNVFSFAYGSPSTLLVMHHGHVMGQFPSDRGVKQGCALAGMGFAHTIHPVYQACVADLPELTATAIMDDFTVTGPPDQAFEAYDRYVRLAAPLGVQASAPKTKIQQAAGVPSEFTRRAAAERGIEIVNGNVKCLGGMVGVDDVAAVAWLKDKLAKQSSITDAIKDSRFPLIHALCCAKINNIPKPIFLLRAMPLRVTLVPISDFDRANRMALTPRLLRCSSPLPPSALVSLTQPGRNGGMGLLELEVIAPAARWASVVAAAPDLQRFSAPSFVRAPLPFVVDREIAFDLLQRRGVPRLQAGQPLPDDNSLELLTTLPYSPDDIIDHYRSFSNLSGLQRCLSKQILNQRLHEFLHSDACSNADLLRLTSCRHKSAARWMQPHPAFPTLSDLAITVTSRQWLGLAPVPLMPSHCPLCSLDISAHPWHAFSCKMLKRKSILVRHDRACQLLLRFARDNECTGHFVTKDLARVLPDGHISMAYRTILFDLSGVNVHAPSYQDMKPGQALGARASAKISKNGPYSRDQGCEFVPFVIDQYGSIGPDALQLLKDIQAEALFCSGSPNPLRLSRSSFLHQLSCLWQFENARIVVQWLTMARDKHVRHKVFKQGKAAVVAPPPSRSAPPSLVLASAHGLEDGEVLDSDGADESDSGSSSTASSHSDAVDDPPSAVPRRSARIAQQSGVGQQLPALPSSASANFLLDLAGGFPTILTTT
jgi:hypothetical protein